MKAPLIYGNQYSSYVNRGIFAVDDRDNSALQVTRTIDPTILYFPVQQEESQPITQAERFKDFFGSWEGTDLNDMVDLVYETRSKF